jgi:hypothetical protein
MRSTVADPAKRNQVHWIVVRFGLIDVMNVERSGLRLWLVALLANEAVADSDLVPQGRTELFRVTDIVASSPFAEVRRNAVRTENTVVAAHDEANSFGDRGRATGTRNRDRVVMAIVFALADTFRFRPFAVALKVAEISTVRATRSVPLRAQQGRVAVQAAKNLLRAWLDARPVAWQELARSAAFVGGCESVPTSASTLNKFGFSSHAFSIPENGI